jgi:hypothetical protein
VSAVGASAATTGATANSAAGEALTATGTATLAPTDTERPPDSQIGPGIVGFLVTFAMAVALVFLVRDMNRRIQRLRYGRREDPG